MGARFLDWMVEHREGVIGFFIGLVVGGFLGSLVGYLAK